MRTQVRTLSHPLTHWPSGKVHGLYALLAKIPCERRFEPCMRHQERGIKMKKTNTNKEIEKLKKELVTKAAEHDCTHAMMTNFLTLGQERGKAIDVLLPLVNTEKLTEALAELHDLRVEKKELINKVNYFRSKKGRKFMDRTEEVGFSKAMAELGDYIADHSFQDK